MDTKYNTEVDNLTNLNNKNAFPIFTEKDSAELSELLRTISQASIYGSDEYQRLVLRTEELIDKFGGADNILDQLDKQLKYVK